MRGRFLFGSFCIRWLTINKPIGSEAKTYSQKCYFCRMFENPDDISTSGFVPPSEYAVSSRFSEYSELPSRGYCKLFKAQRNGQWFVLKALKPECQQDPVYQGMLEKEFDLMMQLNHPNIVRIYSKEEDPVAGVCMVMEYVDGRPLGDFLTENPPRSVRESVARQILEAIGYCHGKQIIHRDLKPSNILATYNGNRVKLIDFGLSDSDSYAVLKEPAYTKAYAAPEQLAGESVDCRTDLYAFGLILRQLFPKRYACVARKCTQPQKEKRYASAAEVAAAMKKEDRRRRAVPWGIVSLIVVGIVAAALGLTRSATTQNETSEKHPDFVKEVSKNDTSEKAKVIEIQTNPISRTTSLKPSVTEQEGDLLSQACQKVKHDMDSIFRPFEQEIKSGKLKYREEYRNHYSIVNAKMLNCLIRIKKQLPLDMRPVFQEYAGPLWTHYTQKYSDKGKNGEELFPYMDEQQMSKEEYQRLLKEYDADVQELERLSQELKALQAIP